MQYTYKVKDWMIDLVVFIDPEATVSEALALMRRRYIHSLIVNRTETTDYGIITSTDICDKIIAQDGNPAKIKVNEIMTSPLITVTPAMNVKECASTMLKHKIHHLPVMDEHGMLVGMISDTDFLVVAEAMGRAPGEKIT